MRDQLLALPQDDDVWIAGAQLLTIPITPGGPEQDVWLLVVQSRTQYFILGMRTGTTEPDPQQLLSTLIDAMVGPKQGAPRRPAAVERGPNLSWEAVAPMLEGIGIAVRPAGTLSDLNVVFQHISMQMSGRMIPDLPIGPKGE